MVMLDKYSHQLNQCDQKSSTLGHLIKKKWDIIRISTVITGITFFKIYSV